MTPFGAPEASRSRSGTPFIIENYELVYRLRLDMWSVRRKALEALTSPSLSEARQPKFEVVANDSMVLPFEY